MVKNLILGITFYLLSTASALAGDLHKTNGPNVLTSKTITGSITLNSGAYSINTLNVSPIISMNHLDTSLQFSSDILPKMYINSSTIGTYVIFENSEYMYNDGFYPTITSNIIKTYP